MSLSADLKTGNSLEWCAQWPFDGKPEISSVFFIQNVECYFYFYKEFNQNEYPLYLKTKETNAKLKPFSFITYLYHDRSRLGTFCRSQHTFSNCNTYICCYSTRTEERTYDLKPGFPIRYLFNFEHSIGLHMSSEMKTEEKSVQTPSYADTSFMLENMSKDFSKLLDRGQNHDVHFICGDQTIDAHKNILCCRSAIFASMLQSDMVEGKTGNVEIKDMDANILRLFLRYLYTGSLPELTVGTAIEFYRAGDKYVLDNLKKQCADFLTDSVSLENACEILLLADKHSDSHLKKNVINYMLDEEMPIKGENWTDFCNDNPKLAVEVLNLFCQHTPSSIKSPAKSSNANFIHELVFCMIVFCIFCMFRIICTYFMV